MSNTITEVRPTGDRALTVAEACDYLGLGKTALYDRIQRNEIPHERYGRRIVLRQSDLDSYRDSHRVACDKGDQPW